MSDTYTANGRNYNDSPYDSVSNKGGLDEGGHLQRQEADLAINMFQMQFDTLVEGSNQAATTVDSTHTISSSGSIMLNISGPERFFYVGQDIKIIYDATNWMVGIITAYDQVEQTITVALYTSQGAGSYSAWITLAVGPQGPEGITPSIVIDTIPPGLTDDGNAGYVLGDSWIDTEGDKVYRCVDISAGAAVWKHLSLDATAFGTMAFKNEGEVINAKRGHTTLDAAKTFATADVNHEYILTGTTARTWTIDTNSNQPMAASDEIDIFNLSTQDITLQGSGGITVNGVVAGSIVIAPNTGGSLKNLSADLWRYVGHNQTEWA